MTVTSAAVEKILRSTGRDRRRKKKLFALYLLLSPLFHLDVVIKGT